MKPCESKIYAALTQLDNLEILRARFHHHAFGRHYHEGYALGVILNGCETYACEGKLHVAPKGSVVAVNPGEIHDGKALNAQKGWDYFMIYPRLSAAKKALGQLEMEGTGLPVFPESVISDPALAALLVRFMESIDAGDTALCIETRFLELFARFAARHAQFGTLPRIRGKGQDPRVRRVMEMIREGFDAPLTLDRLAEEVGLSAWALLRLFRRQTGLTPYLVQTRLRLDHAKHALARGASPADAAAMCGFADQSHMTRQFKKWMGLTPGEVRIRKA